MTKGPTYRQAGHSDINAIFDVRVSVRENRLDRRQLSQLGITERSIAAALHDDHRAWVAECDNKPVGFAMACSGDGRLFALFVHPEYEALGIGSALLGLALDWLRDVGLSTAWLTTEPRTRAAAFYEHRGWRSNRRPEDGEIRFEFDIDTGPA